MGVVSDALVAVQQGDVVVQVGGIVRRVEADGSDAGDLERLGLIVDSQLPFAALDLQITGAHAEEERNKLNK